MRNYVKEFNLRSFSVYTSSELFGASQIISYCLRLQTTEYEILPFFLTLSPTKPAGAFLNEPAGSFVQRFTVQLHCWLTAWWTRTVAVKAEKQKNAHFRNDVHHRVFHRIACFYFSFVVKIGYESELFQICYLIVCLSLISQHSKQYFSQSQSYWLYLT